MQELGSALSLKLRRKKEIHERNNDENACGPLNRLYIPFERRGYFIEIRRKESVNTCLVLFAIARANPIDFGKIRGNSDRATSNEGKKGKRVRRKWEETRACN